jgi:hypothetical protein
MGRHRTTATVDQMRRDALVSGLGTRRPPTLRAVKRRRFELWSVAVFAMVALGVALVLPSLWQSVPEPFTAFTPTVARGIVGVLMVALAAYVAEKGFALRRVRHLLIAEQANVAQLETEVDQLSALLTVAKALNSELTLRDLLGLILEKAVEFVHGIAGSIMLVEDAAQLRVVCTLSNDGVRGARVRIGEGLAGRVAASREPLVAPAPFVPHELDPGIGASGAIAVPLISRKELMGVLTVFSGPRPFGPAELGAMTLFAEHAAIAIVNARHYETERRRVAELLELGRV